MSTDAKPSSDRPHVLLATTPDAWDLDEDAEPLMAALTELGVRAEPAAWDDPGVEWASADLVVVRSTWNYARRRDEFVEWARNVEAVTTLANSAGVIAWNTDKRYLAELQDAGMAVVHTEFLEPAGAGGSCRRAIEAFAAGGEFVVKPSVSAGSKDTGRFHPDATGAAGIAAAVGLAERIAAQGRTTMLQPYLGSVDSVGETGLLYFDGDFSHAFNKSALLSAGGEAAHGLFALEQVGPDTAAPDQLALAGRVLEWVARRFEKVPMYARVDLLRAGDGTPILLELELTEPSWFLGTDPASARRAAGAISSRLG